MKNLKIEQIMNGLNTSEYGYELENYDSTTYISDAISEIADNNTSIYFGDIIEFISNNVEDVNNAIAELGWDGCGGDLYKAGQAAEYLKIQNNIYEYLEDDLKSYALKKYVSETDADEIPAELWEELEEVIEANPDRFEEITDVINDYLNREDDEEAEC